MVLATNTGIGKGGHGLQSSPCQYLILTMLYSAPSPAPLPLAYQTMVAVGSESKSRYHATGIPWAIPKMAAAFPAVWRMD